MQTNQTKLTRLHNAMTHKLLRFKNLIKIKKNSFAAKVEIDSVQSNPIVVMRHSWIDDLAVTILQFPDFCFKA